jgi:hypothetical protein
VFDKVQHPGLLFKIRKILPQAYYRTLESYLMDTLFELKFKDEIRTLRKTKAGVPQGSVLGPVLYTVYTSDLLPSHNTTVTSASDTATYEDPAIASMKLQATINKTVNWVNKWKIKIEANPRILHSPYKTKPV